MKKISKAKGIKAQSIAEIKQMLQSSASVVLVDYKGINVEEVTRMRRQLSEAGIKYKVYKNTLVEIAAKEVGIEGLSAYLSGPTAMAFGLSDPVAPAKQISESIKKLNKMQIKAGILEGKVIDAASVKVLAELPSKKELVAKLLGSLNAPVSNLVGVLGGPVRAFVYALNSIKEGKESANG